MAALPARIASIPTTRTQFFKLLLGLFKLSVTWLEDFWKSSHEGLFRGNAIDPTLLGKLFVVGKAEA